MTRPPSPPDSTRAEIDAAYALLRDRATAWARLRVAEKQAMLDDLRHRTVAYAEVWAERASEAKGLPAGSELRAEEWLSGPSAVAAYASVLSRTLGHVRAGSLHELVEGRVRQRPDGQVVVRAFPDDVYDRLLTSGITAELWLEPGVEPRDVPLLMATVYDDPEPTGGVALVLGAGNIASIPALDVLYELYAHGRTVLLKLNPVNAYLGPVFEDVFGAFVADGYLRFAYGGADVGATLTRHGAPDAIHVTGSAATHDAIVYGTGPDAAARKAEDRPEIDRPVTAELGGVSPAVVVPGDWSEPDLRFQAEHVVTMRTHNAGFNCIAAQVLVLAEDWPQRAAFVDEVRAVFRETEPRPAYYPGASDRLGAVRAAYPQAEVVNGHVLVPDVPADDAGPAFREETFASALFVTALPGGADPAAWLASAVDFCNDRLAGTLGANVLAHPATLRALGDRLEAEVARLRYGTVAVNAWTGVAFALPQAAWGAFPGHARNDVQSGVGKVHNALLLDRVQKTVVRGPFAEFPRSLLLGERHGAPRPPWFVTNQTAEATARKWTALAADPDLTQLPGLFASALRG